MKALAPLALLLLTHPALGCQEIRSANEDLQARLDGQNELQDKFEDQMKKEAQRCQEEAARLSAASAKAATSESCVALRENAQYNKELNALTDGCAQKFSNLHDAMDGMRTTFYVPFHTSIDLVVKEDQGDAEIQALCPREIAETAEINEGAQKLLARAKKDVAQAQSDFEKFFVLAATTKGFQDVTQNGFDRCAAEQAPLVAEPAKGAGAGQGAPDILNVPKAPPRKDGNTITGVEEDRRKRQLQPMEIPESIR